MVRRRRSLSPWRQTGPDGKGFDPATARMGSGVQGMTDRMAALGGTLKVSSEPGRGTRVTGTIPVSSLALAE
jgi:glucose-6-phosphate-specific signal transduction histidine kinase